MQGLMTIVCQATMRAAQSQGRASTLHSVYIGPSFAQKLFHGKVPMGWPCITLKGQKPGPNGAKKGNGTGIT